MSPVMGGALHLGDVLRRGSRPFQGGAPAAVAAKPLRILFMVSAHNSLSQRAYIALSELGHEVTVVTVESPEAMEQAVVHHRPELVVCPFLKRIIPESVWTNHRCLVVHPGPLG